MHSAEFTLHVANAYIYDEYHEPKVKKTTFYVVRYQTNDPTLQRVALDHGGWTTLGKIKITLTDGKLTSVEIVEGE